MRPFFPFEEKWQAEFLGSMSASSNSAAQPQDPGVGNARLASAAANVSEGICFKNSDASKKKRRKEEEEEELTFADMHIAESECFCDDPSLKRSALLMSEIQRLHCSARAGHLLLFAFVSHLGCRCPQPANHWTCTYLLA